MLRPVEKQPCETEQYCSPREGSRKGGEGTEGDRREGGTEGGGGKKKREGDLTRPNLCQDQAFNTRNSPDSNLSICLWALHNICHVSEEKAEYKMHQQA